MHASSSQASAPYNGFARRVQVLALSRYLRACRTHSLSRALRRWMERVAAVLQQRGSSSGATLVSLRATSSRALHRVSAQAAAMAEARQEREALEALLAERERALTLAQRQLAQQAERRRAVEAGGRHAAGELDKLKYEAGQKRATEAALHEAREAEGEWRREALRCIQEVRLLGREMYDEEYASGTARKLVAACHGALREQQDDISRLRAAALDADASLAEGQLCLAAEVRGATALLERSKSEQRAALETARRKAAAAAQEVQEARESCVKWQRLHREQTRRAEQLQTRLRLLEKGDGSSGRQHQQHQRQHQQTPRAPAAAAAAATPATDAQAPTAAVTRAAATPATSRTAAEARPRLATPATAADDTDDGQGEAAADWVAEAAAEAAEAAAAAAAAAAAGVEDDAASPASPLRPPGSASAAKALRHRGDGVAGYVAARLLRVWSTWRLGLAWGVWARAACARRGEQMAALGARQAEAAAAEEGARLRGLLSVCQQKLARERQQVQKLQLDVSCEARAAKALEAQLLAAKSKAFSATTRDVKCGAGATGAGAGAGARRGTRENSDRPAAAVPAKRPQRPSSAAAAVGGIGGDGGAEPEGAPREAPTLESVGLSDGEARLARARAAVAKVLAAGAFDAAAAARSES